MSIYICLLHISGGWAKNPKNGSQRVEIDKWIRNSGLDQSAIRWFEYKESGTTKGKPERARNLKRQGLSVEEIANAMAVSRRTIFRYLSQ